MTTDTNGAGGLPSETNCPSHDEEIVVTSKNFEAGFIAGMKFCETHFHDGELCRATREGDGEVDTLIKRYEWHMAVCAGTGSDTEKAKAAIYRDVIHDLRTLSRVAVQERMAPASHYREALIGVRQRQFIASGMKVEQARVHAETEVSTSEAMYRTKHERDDKRDAARFRELMKSPRSWNYDLGKITWYLPRTGSGFQSLEESLDAAIAAAQRQEGGENG